MNSINISRDIDKLITLCKNKKNTSEKISILKFIKRIPHKNISEYIENIVISILSDKNVDIIEKKFILDSEFSTINSHIFYFNNFHYPKYPIIYRIQSSQYILSKCQRNSHIWRECLLFLYYTSINKNLTDYKNNCQSILKENGIVDIQSLLDEQNFYNNRLYTEPNSLENNIEKKLEKKCSNSDKKRRIILSRRTVYEDGQNVHTSDINNSVKNIVDDLLQTYKRVLDNKIETLNSLSKRITLLSKEKDDICRRKIIGSFDRILSDTSHIYKNLNLVDIIILVWCKIRDSLYKEELEKRLMEELIDMNGMCVTGHFSRTVNILSGFHYDIKISDRDRIKSIVFNYYNKKLNSLEERERDDILEEMIGENGVEKKKLYNFISTYSIENKIRDENIDIENFKTIYMEVLKQYCGEL